MIETITYEGDLKNIPIHQVLQFLIRNQDSGILAFADGRNRFEIHFHKGNFVEITSNFILNMNLTSILWSSGLISDNDYSNIKTNIYQFPKSSGKIGQILLQKGIITPAELYQALGIQYEKKLVLIMGIKEGFYQFDTSLPPPPTPEIIWTPRVGSGILKGIEIAVSPGYLRKFFKNFGPNHLIHLNESPLELTKIDAMGSADLFFLEKLKKTKSLQTILDSDDLSKVRIYQLLYFLWMVGHISFNLGDSNDLRGRSAASSLIQPYSGRRAETILPPAFHREPDTIRERLQKAGHLQPVEPVRRHPTPEIMISRRSALQEESPPVVRNSPKSTSSPISSIADLMKNAQNQKLAQAENLQYDILEAKKSEIQQKKLVPKKRYTPEEVIRLAKEGSSLEDADLSGIDLSGADLHNAQLAGVNFQKARLRNTNFRGANLMKSNFCNANLYKSDLSHAKLANANFSRANLSYANLTNADITGVSLEGAQVEGTILKR